MRPRIIARIAQDVLETSRVYFPIALRDTRNVALSARDETGRPFVRHVVNDLVRYSVGSVRPIQGGTLERASLAAAWLARAQDATGAGGLSYGYMPGRKTPGWQPAYPETTGYTIPTLLEYARLSGCEEYRRRAL